MEKARYESRKNANDLLQFDPGTLFQYVDSLKTMKVRRNDPLYIGSFMTKGNKKLTDFINEITSERFLYAQFNLPAKSTCPYATPDCKKFCYAKRDERFPSPKNNRIESFIYSQSDMFVYKMIFTIYSELLSKRYANGTMILRVHESGDFYNIKYLKKWVDIISVFNGKKIVFQFYTKCFVYLNELKEKDPERYTILNNAINTGLVALSLSYDKSMPLKQYVEMLKAKNNYPNANIYAAMKNINDFDYDTVCNCAECAKCGTCTHTTGKSVVVKIH